MIMMGKSICDKWVLFQSVQALYSNVKKLQCSLYIWQRLLKLQLSQDQATVIVGAAHNVSTCFFF